MVARQEFKEILEIGYKLVLAIMPELNELSDKYIRIDGDKYRRAA